MRLVKNEIEWGKKDIKDAGDRERKMKRERERDRKIVK